MKKNILKILLPALVLGLILSALPVTAHGEESGVDLVLPVQVALGETEPEQAETYQLLLTAGEADCPLPEGGAGGSYTLEITGAGSVLLPIRFSRPGIYSYTLRQQAGTDWDAVYDSTVYQLTVYVTTEDDGLHTTLTLHARGVSEKPDSLSFVNLYPTPAEHDPPVRKEIVGDRPAEDSEFAFRLEAVGNTAGLEENPMPDGSEGQSKTVTVLGAGEEEFGVITFRHSGRYVYRMTEVDTGVEGYRYDPSVYTVTYDVTLQGTALVAQRTVMKDGIEVESADITFTNRYTAPAEAPHTGDPARVGLWIALAAASAAGCVGVSLFARKREV